MSKKALIVGINDYANSPLEGCVNDALEVNKLLSKNEDGSPNFDVKIANNIQRSEDLVSLIKCLFEDDSESALFYFSGHGFLDENGGYLVTPDYDVNNFGVSMGEVLSIANNSRCSNRIIILDCCYSGIFGMQKIVDGNSSIISEGVTILTASRETQPAMEIDGHGVFTNLLLEGLRGGAADIMGHITPGTIYAYIDKALGEWEQRPIFKTNISRFTLLRNAKPHLSREILAKIVEYFPTSNSEFKLNPSFEFTNTPEVEHRVIEPYAKEENTKILKNLQIFESVGLVVPVSEAHMYFAVMKSKSCKLTPIGQHYWNLITNNRI